MIIPYVRYQHFFSYVAGCLILHFYNCYVSEIVVLWHSYYWQEKRVTSLQGYSHTRWIFLWDVDTPIRVTWSCVRRALILFSYFYKFTTCYKNGHSSQLIAIYVCFIYKRLYIFSLKFWLTSDSIRICYPEYVKHL